MHGKVKLTKRQIKEDKFATFMFTAKDQLQENWQYWIIGVVAVGLAIAAVAYYVSSSKSARVDAGTKYASAIMDTRQGNTQVAIMALNQIVTDNADKATTKDALFSLARLNVDSKNYPEATRYYEQFISKFGDDKLMHAAALAGIAICQENQGQFAEAAATYAEASQAYPDGPSEGEYLLSGLRCSLLVGDVERARTGLAAIKDKFKGSDLASRAERLFAEKGSTTSGS